MLGRFCRVEPLDPARHAADLFAANRADAEGRIWTYLPYGPFDTVEAYGQWVGEMTRDGDPMFYAIVDKASGKASGVASYLRITPAQGVIEVGHINYSPALQRTRIASEAICLMAAHVFDDLGYRRFEWKCDDQNAASMRAAVRFGFSYEGTFRQDMVVKGRNRDSAWFSILDSEWPAAKAAFQAWLDPANFDDSGKQKRGLKDLRGTRPSA